MKNKITIERIQTFSIETLEAFNKLLSQLDTKIPKRTEEFVREVLESPSVLVFVARDINNGTIIAMATLVIFHVLSGKRATIEDFVVDQAYRGRGIGRKLLQIILETARKEGISHLDLTSRSFRIAANNLYLSLGFKKRDTNAYRYIAKQ